MFENEIKVKVLDPSKTSSFFISSGWSCEEFFAEDFYFSHPCREFERGEELRLRKSREHNILTYKYGSGESRLEIETEVGPEIEVILEKLGFKKSLWKRKEGYRFKKGDVEAVLVRVIGGVRDKVVDIGWFLELEVRTERPSKEAIRKLKEMIREIPGIGDIDEEFYAEKIIKRLVNP